MKSPNNSLRILIPSFLNRSTVALVPRSRRSSAASQYGPSSSSTITPFDAATEEDDAQLASDLLDDDPFADLSHIPSSATSISTPSLTSDYEQCTGDDEESYPSSGDLSLEFPIDLTTPSPSPTSPDGFISPNEHDDEEQDEAGPLDEPIFTILERRPSIRQRPIVRQRPSLPSLTALARDNIVLPSPPRSSAAARFPLEPWGHLQDLQEESLGELTTHNSEIFRHSSNSSSNFSPSRKSDYFERPMPPSASSSYPFVAATSGGYPNSRRSDNSSIQPNMHRGGQRGNGGDRERAQPRRENGGAGDGGDGRPPRRPMPITTQFDTTSSSSEESDEGHSQAHSPAKDRTRPQPSFRSSRPNTSNGVPQSASSARLQPGYPSSRSRPSTANATSPPSASITRPMHFDSVDDTDSSDDVPLAQRIPTALTAQKSIRVKDRQERERKRTQLVAKSKAKTAGLPATSDVALADDLMKRLMLVQQQKDAEEAQARQPPQPAAKSRPPSWIEYDEFNRPIDPSVPRPRPTRSRTVSHAASPSPRVLQAQQPPMPSFPRRPSEDRRTTSLSRSATTSRARLRPSEDVPPPPVPRSPNTFAFPADPYNDRAHLVPTSGTIRRSQDSRRSRPSTAADETGDRQFPPPRTSKSSRPSVEGGRPRANTLTSIGANPPYHINSQPPPPLPRLDTNSSTGSDPYTALNVPGHQQRIFIRDKQTYKLVDVNASTRAIDVINTISETGALFEPGQGSSGGWALYELNGEFGMERPIREFELLSDVFSSWNRESRDNALIVRKTVLAPSLKASGVPSSSPLYSGTIRWEVKRGKWSKRCLTLREHSLFISKSETSKDETILCTLSNFDGYTVTRPYKAPKSFVFALKSTDNLNLFENPSDSVHIFSCDKVDGEVWLERILVARSYVLHQERTILFQQPSDPVPILAATNNFSKPSQSLSRAGTRKRPAQPLVPHPLSPPLPSNLPLRNDVFNEGSLLAKAVSSGVA